LLHSIFIVLAVRAGSHWAISEEEATQLSKAVGNVARHYPVASTQKAADWSQLVLVLAVLAVPRAVESWNMKPALGPPPGLAAVPVAPRPNPVAPPDLPRTPAQLDPVAMDGASLTVQ
jgi:hypothetical protein